MVKNPHKNWQNHFKERYVAQLTIKLKIKCNWSLQKPKGSEVSWWNWAVSDTWQQNNSDYCIANKWNNW
jgi:hypothetical protein